MQISGKTVQPQPILPPVFSLILSKMPALMHSKALVMALNKIFENDLKAGELDFLQARVIRIAIKDASLEYSFTLNKGKFYVADKKQAGDLFLQGTAYDYLLLASRCEDTDTLFFNRRLQMHGDTELGLYVKNFLDGLDMDSHKIPAYLETILKKSLPLYERLFSQ